MKRIKMNLQLAQFDFQMNQMARQLSITTAEAMQIVRSIGYTCLDCDFRSLTSDFCTAMKDAGLKLSLMYVFFDPAKDNSELIQNVVEKAVQNNAVRVMPIPNSDPKPLRNKAFADMRAFQISLAENNISTVLEDFADPGKSFNSLAGLQNYLDNVPGLGCCFDTGNFAADTKPLLCIADSLMPKIRHIHIKDFAINHLFAPDMLTDVRGRKLSSAPAGCGILPVETVVKSAIKAGYRGILAVEHANVYNERVAMERSYSNISRWLNELDCFSAE